MELYAVYDSCAEHWGSLFGLENDSAACRAFVASVGVPDSVFMKNPMDYVLFHVGSYDDSTGEVLGCTPVRVMSALEAVHVVRSAREVEDNRQLKLAGGSES